MNQHIRKGMLPALALALAVLALAVGCNHGPGAGGFGEEGFQERIAGKIDAVLDEIQASPDQRERIRGIVDALHQEIATQMGDHQTLHGTVLAELRSERPDAQKLGALLDGQIDRVRIVGHRILDAVLEAREVLTPEQRAAVFQKIEEHHGRLRDHLQRMHKRFGDHP